MITVAAATIVRDGRVLLSQRLPTRDFPWMWESPGGKVEEGESPRKAVEREVAEELGWWHGWIGEQPYTSISMQLDRGAVDVAFFAARPGRHWTPHLKDVAGVAWFTWEEMEVFRDLLVPGNRALLDRRREIGPAFNRYLVVP
jgi:ADP-ribose pyrophosphatase YjhB (NUDIX family)